MCVIRKNHGAVVLLLHGAEPGNSRILDSAGSIASELTD